MSISKFRTLGLGFCLLSATLDAQVSAIAQPAASASTVVPGKGLSEHDFFYAGESRDRKMFIVRKGEIVWSYDDPAGKGEISDAVLLSNGNVLFAHQFGVTEISPDKKVIWNYDAPEGAEIHTAQPIGNDHVLFIQNGDPALLKVINIKSHTIEKEIHLPVGKSKSVHGQFRHARLTREGTLLVAHMDMDKVCEYDENGKELWSFPAEAPWGVSQLSNGNVLITDRAGVREVSRRGDTAWGYTRANSPDYTVTNLQQAWRMPNGNTVINNWQSLSDKPNPPLQALEITPDKKVVWVLRSWTSPADLALPQPFSFWTGRMPPEKCPKMYTSVKSGRSRPFRPFGMACG